MTPPDLSKNPALWLGLRQTESLREALKATLNGQPLSHQSIKQWLATQNIEVSEEFPERVGITIALTTGFQDGVGIHPEMLVRGRFVFSPLAIFFC